MNIVILGAGKVAALLGKRLKFAGYQVRQVYSRNVHCAQTLAQVLGASAVNDLDQIQTNADLYIIAVTDSAIEKVAACLNVSSGIVVHTAGAVPANVLSHLSKHYGVLYPLQSITPFTKENVALPLCIAASDSTTIQVLQKLATDIGSVVIPANDDERKKMHLAAVFVNNFTHHLFTLIADYCEKENIDFKCLLPLIKETAERLTDHHPLLLQTGPAIRNDTSTIHRHMQMLQPYPHLQKIYDMFTQSIIANHKATQQN